MISIVCNGASDVPLDSKPNSRTSFLLPFVPRLWQSADTLTGANHFLFSVSQGQPAASRFCPFYLLHFCHTPPKLYPPGYLSCV